MMRMNRAACGALLALSPWLAVGCAGTGSRPMAAARTQHAADQRLQMARQFERDGELQKAVQLYSELQQEAPRDSEIAHRLGIIYTRLGSHDQAAEQFAKALRSAPNDAKLLSDVGYAEYLRGDLAAAADHLEQALDQQADNRRAVNNLALVYGYQGRFDESLDLFRRFGSEVEALSSLANIHRQRGENDLALACYEEILELDPANSAAAAAVAALAPQEMEFPVAVAATEAALRSIPDDTAPLPEEEFLQINRQDVLTETPAMAETPAHPLSEVAAAETTEAISEDMFESPVEVTEVPEPAAAADDGFELPVIQPGRPELAVQPEAAEVAVESGFQIESNRVQTSVVAPQQDAVLSDEQFFETPEPTAAETAASETFEVPVAEGATKVESQQPAQPVVVVGIGGYCPVSLRNDREMVAGVEAWEAEYKGVTYRFSSPEALAEFHVDPESYIPVAGGLDVVAVREGREITAGSLEHATWFRDRLYLFASADTLATFRSNARTFADGF